MPRSCLHPTTRNHRSLKNHGAKSACLSHTQGHSSFLCRSTDHIQIEASRISSIWNSSRIASSSSRCLGDGSWMLGFIQQPRVAGIPSPFPATQPNFFCPVRRRRRQLSKSPAATFELENKAFASDGTLACLLSSSRCPDLASVDEKQRTGPGSFARWRHAPRPVST
jgi:hypothetical protein